MEVTLEVEGPRVGAWMTRHYHDLSTPMLLGGSDSALKILNPCDPRWNFSEYRNGRCTFVLTRDGNEFANTAEAVQVCLEQMGKLPDADMLAHASIRVEVKAG